MGPWLLTEGVIGQPAAATDPAVTAQSAPVPMMIENFLLRGMWKCRSNCEPSCVRARFHALRAGCRP
jgi:hypothetical protein